MIDLKIQAIAQAATGAAGLVLAQTPVVDPWEQLITTCVCGSLLAWTLIKTIPAMAREHRAACKELASSIDQQTEAMRDRDQKLIDLLQENIKD